MALTPEQVAKLDKMTLSELCTEVSMAWQLKRPWPADVAEYIEAVRKRLEIPIPPNWPHNP
jgi:hypothetical protein